MKRYRCPFCNKMIERNNMGYHIQNYHEELVPEGFTSNRLAFNILNKNDKGQCVPCGKESEWNENNRRYNRYCSEKCRKNAAKKAKENMIKKYNKEHLLDDPDVQIKMLKNRKISGKYKFKNGTEKDYVGKFEYNFLEYLDKVMKMNPDDIITDYPLIEYYYNGKKRFYIPDFYLEPYNLIIEIKDGGDNKNNNPAMIDTRNKTIEKEKAIKKMNKYNYLRLTDNNFEQFMICISEIKNQNNDTYTHIINENSIDNHIKNIRGYLNG